MRGGGRERARRPAERAAEGAPLERPADAEGFVYGFHPLREVLRQRPHDVVEVMIALRAGNPRREELERLCERHGVARREVGFGQLNRLVADVAGTHNGVAAWLRRSAPVAGEGADRELVVLVEDVQDPRNLGALLRVCEGAGVGRVLIRDRGSAPVSSAVERTSAGAAEWLPVERITNTAQALEGLRDEGFWIYGAEADGQPPWQLDLRGKVVLCFGGEEKGLRQRTRGLCDAAVGLPMRGHVESLNLSTAAAAILYEAVRQRTTAAEAADSETGGSEPDDDGGRS